MLFNVNVLTYAYNYIICKMICCFIQDTRSFIIHQLLVKVAGWQRIAIPISVDKIGVFFREVWPSNDSEMDLLPELSRDRGSVRLVFAISLSDTQKVVNVRSALVLHNTMELPLQVSCIKINVHGVFGNLHLESQSS